MALVELITISGEIAFISIIVVIVIRGKVLHAAIGNRSRKLIDIRSLIGHRSRSGCQRLVRIGINI